MQHIIIVMQENHSFDNYFGVLPYAVGTPYDRGPCDPDNHACVDGLSCKRHAATGAYYCRKRIHVEFWYSKFLACFDVDPGYTLRLGDAIEKQNHESSIHNSRKG